MRNIFAPKILAACLSLAAFAGFTPQVASAQSASQPVDANCFDSGGSIISQDSINSGSAVGTDKIFAAHKGMITLQPHPMTRQGGFGPLNYTAWINQQSIDLGFGYSLLVHLNFQTQEALGDEVVEAPSLRVSSQLLFKGQPISAASVQVNELVKNESGQSVLVVDFQLDNLPLRLKLGAVNSPDQDLIPLVQGADRQAVFNEFGDGNGVLTKAHVICSVPAPGQ